MLALADQSQPRAIRGLSAMPTCREKSELSEKLSVEPRRGPERAFHGKESGPICPCPYEEQRRLRYKVAVPWPSHGLKLPPTDQEYVGIMQGTKPFVLHLVK
ncbi:unnamed protein product [Pleuronectes platessa]|uniref:Uncharacterized protein n=1 Tax=Pleuronectes platessa TaxID=8262 RepID=A0A9N7V7S0_PLEPL|nr:unnamed protein product [Pleuronectes platessa]